MAVKNRSSVLRSVRTPEALVALQAWLDALATSTRDQGEASFRRGQVIAVGARADHYVEATVLGEENHQVKLYFTRGSWTSKCNCETRSNCEHACAAAFAWLAFVASGKPDGVDPAAASAAAIAQATDELVPLRP